MTKRLNSQTLRIGVGASVIDVENDLDNRNYSIEPGNPIPQPLGSLQDQLSEPLFNEYTENLAHIFLRDEINIAQGWKLNAGLRYDQSSIYGSVINPRISLEYTPSLHTAYKILYGEATRTPNNLEISSNGLFVALGNEDLEPSKIRMLEAVAERRISDRVDSKINLFAYQYQDIVGTQESAVSPNGLEFVNLDEAQEGYGAEFRLDWSLNESVEIVLGWAFQDFRGGQTLSIKSPQHQPFAEANLELIRGWNININTTGVVGRSRLDRDDRPDIDDYQLVNFALTNNSLFNRDIEFKLVINNMFDTDARTDVSTSIEEDVPLLDREVRLGFGWNF